MGRGLRFIISFHFTSHCSLLGNNNNRDPAPTSSRETARETAKETSRETARESSRLHDKEGRQALKKGFSGIDNLNSYLLFYFYHSS